MKKGYHIYIALFIILCLLPSAGLLFAGGEPSKENRRTAEPPVLSDEDGLNPYFLSDAGAWFEDHFAFRNEMVTGYAKLLGNVFGTSSQQGVIVGTDGWLFYKDSLEDFQGTGQMTERQLFDVAHTMAMIQEYAKKQGAQFAFTIAPNKNSLYGEYMPYYYQPFRNGKSNMERLKKYLQAEQVNYADLYELFSSREEVLYHKTDSHWNQAGAALASDRILTALGKAHVSYTDRNYQIRRDSEGDLEQMLYPAAIRPEEEIYYDPVPQFTYCEEVENHFAPKISTRSKGSGSLVMYRDSFGNALLPFFAESFENAYFSRALPYQLSDLTQYHADTLVIERAERFLPDMTAEAPVMEAPALYERSQELSTKVVSENTVAEKDLQVSELEETRQGEITKITGKLPSDALNTTSRIGVRVNGDRCYEAFPVSCEDGQEGFSMILPADALRESGNIYAVFCF